MWVKAPWQLRGDQWCPPVLIDLRNLQVKLARLKMPWFTHAVVLLPVANTAVYPSFSSARNSVWLAPHAICFTLNFSSPFTSVGLFTDLSSVVVLNPHWPSELSPHKNAWPSTETKIKTPKVLIMHWLFTCDCRWMICSACDVCDVFRVRELNVDRRCGSKFRWT